MDSIEFTKKFPDEESCKTHFKALRDAQAKKCPHCQGTAFYWKNDKEGCEARWAQPATDKAIKHSIHQNSNRKLRFFYFSTITTMALVI